MNENEIMNNTTELTTDVIENMPANSSMSTGAKVALGGGIALAVVGAVTLIRKGVKKYRTWKEKRKQGKSEQKPVKQDDGFEVPTVDGNQFDE